MDVAMDNKSSDEELAEAGKVIQPFTVTKLFDAITTNEEIDRRIELCLTLALRAELSMKLKPAKGDSNNDKKKSCPQPRLHRLNKSRLSRKGLKNNRDMISIN